MAAFQEAMRAYAKKPALNVTLAGNKQKETPQRAGRKIISLAKIKKTQTPPGDSGINFLKSVNTPNSSQSTPARSLRDLSTPSSIRSQGSTGRSLRDLSTTPRRSEKFSRNGSAQMKQSPQNHTPGDLQTPIASITFQNCTPAVRREVDNILQRLARDPNSRTAASKSEKDGNMDRGCVQYFDSFCIDRYGIRDIPTGIVQPGEIEAFSIPAYENVVNVVALPIQLSTRTKKKDLRSTLGVCFNCGTAGHGARECTKKIDPRAIKQNGNLFRQFGNSAKKPFKERYRGRYYEEDVLRTEVGLKSAPPSSKGRGRGRGSSRGRGRGRGSSRGRGRGGSGKSSHSQENRGINTIASGIQVVEDASNHSLPAPRKIKRALDNFYDDFSSGGGGRGRRRGSGRGSGRGRSRGRGYSPYGRGRGRGSRHGSGRRMNRY